LVTAFPQPRHDHGRCVAAALAAAEARCGSQGGRLTALRRRVLELVWSGHQPVGAYALLEELRRHGHSAQPPTVYRALDFLMEHGLIHRIARLNAYVGCSHPETPHAGQFLLCTGCGSAAEVDDPAISQAVVRRAEGLGFAVSRQTVEIEGLCPACRTPSHER
jgi:Fur family zinc uptake transcriptional regulator